MESYGWFSAASPLKTDERFEHPSAAASDGGQDGMAKELMRSTSPWLSCLPGVTPGADALGK